MPINDLSLRLVHVGKKKREMKVQLKSRYSILNRMHVLQLTSEIERERGRHRRITLFRKREGLYI